MFPQKLCVFHCLVGEGSGVSRGGVHFQTTCCFFLHSEGAAINSVHLKTANTCLGWVGSKALRLLKFMKPFQSKHTHTFVRSAQSGSRSVLSLLFYPSCASSLPSKRTVMFGVGETHGPFITSSLIIFGVFSFISVIWRIPAWPRTGAQTVLSNPTAVARAVVTITAPDIDLFTSQPMLTFSSRLPRITSSSSTRETGCCLGFTLGVTWGPHVSTARTRGL